MLFCYTILCLFDENEKGCFKLSLDGKKPNLRQEMKILIPFAEYISLKSKVEAVLTPDQNGDNGSYFIRSVYFDDLTDSAYYDKESGIERRKKYRIRFYNLSDEVIKLECKEKHGSRVAKRSVSISSECAGRLFYKDTSLLEESKNPLAEQFSAILKTRGMTPAVVVDYEREAFVYPLFNVRITFDKFVSAARADLDSLFSEELDTAAVFENSSVILAVKYDECITSYLTSLLSSVRGSRLSLSKYCLCRNALTQKFMTNFAEIREETELWETSRIF